MRIVEGNKAKPFTVLAVEHNDETVIFDVSRLGKTAAISTERILEYINLYFSVLPKNRQDAIFEVYTRVRDILDRVYMDAKRHAMIANQVKELYAQIQIDEVGYYFSKNMILSVPGSIMSRYEDLEISERKAGDPSYRKRTYIRKEYDDLVHMAIALKAMLPIWGDYLAKISAESMGYQYKESRCMELLKNTSFLKCDAMLRLREYIEITIPTNKDIMSGILHGMGTTMMPDWMLSIAVVRKLCRVEVSSTDDATNLVSVVYNSVMTQVRGMDRKLSGSANKIRGRIKPTGSDDSDENRDITSMYKIKEQRSIGDLIDNDRYALETKDIVTRMTGREPDPLILQDCEGGIAYLSSIGFEPMEMQERIVRWLISPLMSPHTPDNVSYTSLIHLFAACQAILIEWGLPDLAALLTAEQMLDDAGLPTGAIDARSRFTKEWVAHFEHTHPYYHVKGGKSVEIDNIAMVAVDEATRFFSYSGWLVRTPIDFDKYVRTKGGQYIVSTEIKTMLCVMMSNIEVKLEETLKLEEDM